MPLVSVYIRFRESFKWPLRPGDTLELWSQDHHLVGQLDASLMLDLLASHIRTARLVTILGESINLDALTSERLHLAMPRQEPDAIPLPRLPPAKITREQKAMHRVQRRRRRKGPG